jgi:hypothetical protein
MMRKISNWLYRVTNGWIALVGLVIFILFTALVLPGQSSDAEMRTGSAESPDLALYYSAQDLYRMAEDYGEAGRAAYIRARFSFDIVWPLVYTFFLVTAITWLFGRAFPQGSSWRLANLAPLIGMAFDFLENISTSLVMWRYPLTIPVVDSLAGVFTLLKWFFVGMSMVLLVLGLAVAIYQGVRRKVKSV